MGALERARRGELAPGVALLESAWAKRTIIEYRRWAKAYMGFCRERELDPWVWQSVAQWLESLKERYRVPSIEQGAAAIRFLFLAKGLPNPLQNEPIRLLMRALRREIGTARRRVRPLMPEHLASLRWDDGIKGARDRAMLLVGFGAALRVSELVALNYEDLEFTPEGVILTIRKSKTDQERKGREVAIPRVAGPLCPVRALEVYLIHRGRHSGPLFLAMHKGTLTQRRIHQASVRKLIKDYIDRAGLDATAYSTHSLRAGLATTAALRGADLEAIATQTGHRSLEVLRGYIRRANLFQRNAAELAFRT